MMTKIYTRLVKIPKSMLVFAGIILLASPLLSVIGYCMYSEILSTYKFGIIKGDYPKYFTEDYKELNPDYFPTIEGINDYSSFTKIKLPFNDKFQLITIEHLIRVIKYDIELIPEVKGENYLFFGIEFEKGNVNNISITHEFEGQKLETAGTYIYHYPMKPNGEIDDTKKFNVIKLTSDSINETGRFIYVKIYKMPELQSNWIYQHVIRKRYWFNSPMKETIVINYTDKGSPKEITYEFYIYWLIHDSFLSRLIHIT